MTKTKRKEDMTSCSKTEDSKERFVKSDKQGILKIEKSEIIYGDSKYLEETGLEGEYYLFHGTMKNGESARMLCPTNEESAEYETLRHWTGKNRLRDLKNEGVPVRRYTDNLYRIDGFDGNPVDLIPIPLIKKMVSKGLMDYKNGLWVVNDIGTTLSYVVMLSVTVVPYILLLSLLSIAGGLLYIPYAILLTVLVNIYGRESDLSQHESDDLS